MDILTYGLLNKKVEEAKNVSSEKITEAVNNYLDDNPPTTGATTEQVAQIDKNAADISELKGDLVDLNGFLDVNENSRKVEFDATPTAYVNGYYKTNLNSFIESTDVKSALIDVEAGYIITPKFKTIGSNYRVFDALGNEITNSGNAYFMNIKNQPMTMPNGAKKIQLTIQSNEFSIIGNIRFMKSYELTSLDSNRLLVLERKKCHSFTNNDADCFSAFIEEMQKKANDIGMSGTVCVSPQGYEQYSTVEDLMRMLINACSYNDILTIWNKKQRSVKKGPNSFITIESTVKSDSLENNYDLLGGKTGSTGGSSGQFILCSVCRNEFGDIIACVASGCDSADGRFEATKELMDIATNILHTENYTPTAPTHCNECAVCLLPPCNSLLVANKSLRFLYKLNEKNRIKSESTIKILTVMTAIDFIPTIHETVKVTNFDVTSGSGNYYVDGDILSVEDILYSVLLPSSNTSARLLARLAGDYIINSRNSYL